MQPQKAEWFNDPMPPSFCCCCCKLTRRDRGLSDWNGRSELTAVRNGWTGWTAATATSGCRIRYRCPNAPNLHRFHQGWRLPWRIQRIARHSDWPNKWRHLWLIYGSQWWLYKATLCFYGFYVATTLWSKSLEGILDWGMARRCISALFQLFHT